MFSMRYYQYFFPAPDLDLWHAIVFSLGFVPESDQCRRVRNRWQVGYADNVFTNVWQLLICTVVGVRAGHCAVLYFIY